MSDPPVTDQLALDVDRAVVVAVVERRGDLVTPLRIGPLAEPDARRLAALLLNRPEPPPSDGPWRCAVAGGSREVRLESRG